MIGRNLRFVLGAVALWLTTPAAYGQTTLTIGEATLVPGTTQRVDLFLDSVAPTEAFTIAAQYDPSVLEVVSAGVAGTVTETVGAELVFPEVFPTTGGFILGVFLDVDPPFDGQVIPAVAATPIAHFDVAAATSPASPLASAIAFVDGAFGSPPIDNTVRDDSGTVIDAASGLGLVPGEVTLVPVNVAFHLEAGVEITQFEVASVAILLDNDFGPVNAYSITVAHPDLLGLEQITLQGTEGAAAELVVTDVQDLLGTVDVVLDADPPFLGQSIAVGLDRTVARFEYRCLDTPLLPSPDEVVSLTFDGLNTITSGGTTVIATTTGGSVTCIAAPPPNTIFRAGDPSGLPIVAAPGQTTTVHLFCGDDDDPLQAFQMALALDCNLTIVGLFSPSGLVTDLGAEFVDSNFDNDPADGDGCELVLGVLLDAVPPFDGQTLPISAEPVEVGSFPVVVDTAAAPGSSLEITFPESATGAGAIPIENIAVIDFESIEVALLEGTTVEVVDVDPFVRGDANDDGRTDIADATSILSQIFAGSTPCFAATDVDANGVLDLEDFFAFANFQFLSGPGYPGPYPACGVSATESCGRYTSCP